MMRPCCQVLTPAVTELAMSQRCPGTEHERDPEYGSLAQGGSYEVFVCDRCGHCCRSQLPD